MPLLLAASLFILSGEFPVAPERYAIAPNFQLASGAAFDGENYLVVWTDRRSEADQVYASRISRAGDVLDPLGFRIGQGSNPDVAWSTSSQSYLVIWKAPGYFQGFAGQRVDRNGTLIGSPIAIPNPQPGPLPSDPAIVSSPAGFLVTLRGLPATAGLFNRSGNLVRWLQMNVQASAASDGSGYVVFGPSSDLAMNKLVMSRIDAVSGETAIIRAFDRPNFAAGAVWTGDSYLLTWSEPAASIVGMFVDRDGNAISDVITIRGDQGYTSGWKSQSVGDGTAVVTWSATSADLSSSKVYAAHVTRRGAEEPKAIAATNDYAFVGALASDGSRFLAVSNRISSVPNYTADVYATILDASGAPRHELTPISMSAVKQSDITTAFLGSSTLTAWTEENGDGISRLDLNDRLVSEGSRFPVLASASDQALLIWLQQKVSSYALLASRVTDGGQILDDPPIELSNQALSPSSSLDARPSHPAAVWSGDSYLVTWSDDHAKLRLVRVTREGVVLDVGAIASAANAPQLHPTIAMGRDSALVVWQDGVIPGPGCMITCPTPPPEARILGLRVAANGQSIDSVPFSISPGLTAEFRPAVAWNGTEFAVAWLSVYQNRVAATRIVDGSKVGELITIADADARPAEVRLTAVGATWLAAWNEDGTVKARFLDDGVPFVISPIATSASQAYVASNGRAILAAYQRLTPGSTNVPRLFYRWIGADRGRAVRR